MCIINVRLDGMSKEPIKDISFIIRWWENDLTDTQRTSLMNGYVWSGTVEERHEKLRAMYDKWNKLTIKQIKLLFDCTNCKPVIMRDISENF